MLILIVIRSLKYKDIFYYKNGKCLNLEVANSARIPIIIYKVTANH